MSVLKIFSMLSLVFLNGCASTAETVVEDRHESVETPAKIESSPKIVEKEKAKNNELKTVETAIEPNVLYMLLAAEIAGQRGHYDIALEGYMEAAKRVKDPRVAEKAAQIAMYIKNNKKTNEALSLWMNQDPKNGDARKTALLSAFKNGNKNQVINQLNILLKDENTNFDAILVQLVSELQKEGKNKFIYDVLESLSAKHSTRAGIYFVQSLLALQMKNLDLANAKIDKALELNANWEQALMLQTQIALMLNQTEKAKETLQKASISYPKNTNFKKLLAQLSIKAGKYQEATDIYKSLTDLNEKDVESQISLALLYLQLNQDDSAEVILKNLQIQSEWSNQANFYLGKLEEKRNHPELALSYFDKVTEGNFIFDARMSSAILLAKQKKFVEADLRLNLLSDKFLNQKTRIKLTQASLYSEQNLPEKAFDVLTQALETEPEQKELLYTRALIAEKLGRIDVLENDLKKILTKHPNDAESLNALGYTLLNHTKKLSEAEKYLQKAIKLRPEEAVIIDSFGWLLFKKGKYEHALTQLQLAYQKQPNGEIAAHLCETLWLLGRKEEAKKVILEGLKEFPTDEFLLEFKKRILDATP